MRDATHSAQDRCPILVMFWLPKGMVIGRRSTSEAATHILRKIGVMAV